MSTGVLIQNKASYKLSADGKKAMKPKKPKAKAAAAKKKPATKKKTATKKVSLSSRHSSFMVFTKTAAWCLGCNLGQ